VRAYCGGRKIFKQSNNKKMENKGNQVQRLYSKHYDSFAEWNGSAWEDKKTNAYFFSLEKAANNTYYPEKSTHELAAEWFSSKSYLEQHALSDKYFESRNPSLLTIEQVEEIWKNEVQLKELRNSYHNAEYIEPKLYNQQEVDRLLDKQAAETTAQILKNNQKQFKEFNPELFKAYIDKFSEEDKIKAMVVLLENQKEEYKFNCFLAALKQMNLDSHTHSNIMTLVALKDI
jgi:hypothetical protein